MGSNPLITRASRIFKSVPRSPADDVFLCAAWMWVNEILLCRRIVEELAGFMVLGQTVRFARGFSE